MKKQSEVVMVYHTNLRGKTSGETHLLSINLSVKQCVSVAVIDFFVGENNSRSAGNVNLGKKKRGKQRQEFNQL